MQNLQRLGLSFALMSVLALTAFAGETPTGPCAPGETPTGPGPCQSVSMTLDDSVTPGETPTPPASTAGYEYSLADAAVDLLQSVLLIF